MSERGRKHDYLDSSMLGAGGEVMDASKRHRERGVRFFVQERHEDGHRWVNVRSFESEAEARAMVERLADDPGEGPEQYRVHQVDDDPGGD